MADCICLITKSTTSPSILLLFLPNLHSFLYSYFSFALAKPSFCTTAHVVFIIWLFHQRVFYISQSAEIIWLRNQYGENPGDPKGYSELQNTSYRVHAQTL